MFNGLGMKMKMVAYQENSCFESLNNVKCNHLKSVSEFHNNIIGSALVHFVIVVITCVAVLRRLNFYSRIGGDHICFDKNLDPLPIFKTISYHSVAQAVKYMLAYILLFHFFMYRMNT